MVLIRSFLRRTFRSPSCLYSTRAGLTRLFTPLMLTSKEEKDQMSIGRFFQQKEKNLSEGFQADSSTKERMTESTPLDDDDVGISEDKCLYSLEDSQGVSNAFKQTLLKRETDDSYKDSDEQVLKHSIDSNENRSEEIEDAESLVAQVSSKKTDKFVETAEWKKGEKVPYAALCKTFEEIEKTTKRLEILQIITNFFRLVMTLTPDNLKEIVYLCVNQIAPAYEGIELGVGETILMKALAESTGRNTTKIKLDMEQLGDLGLLAEQSRAIQPTMFQPPKLTISQVYKTLKEIALTSGSSSMQKKLDKIKGLLVACRGNEARFLIRSLEGKLRIGLAEQSVLTALGHAAALYNCANPTAEMLLKASITLKNVYNEVPNYDLVIPALLEHGLDNLPNYCKLTPGIPLRPMLAHPTKSITDILNRFEGLTFTCEFKYDGERAQIHRQEDGRITVFSRNSENITGKYPDVVNRLALSAQFDPSAYVLDCEVVAWEKEQKKILPFQTLSTRKRKDVQAADIKVQVCLFVFDLLYIDGKSLLKESLKTRRELLTKYFRQVEDELMFAEEVIARNTEEIELFFEKALSNNCEGLMVKTFEAESQYEPAKRSTKWLKLKKDYLAGIGDSVDCVVIGAWYGRGKRTGTYGAYLLAIYDPENEEYQTICKIGTGFSDEQLASHYCYFKDKTISLPKSYYRFDESQKPEVWFEPSQVWEVKAADLSISPAHKAALGHIEPSKGISLRFPRFIRIRDDKSPEQATDANLVAELYRNQQLNKNSTSLIDEDDY